MLGVKDTESVTSKGKPVVSSLIEGVKIYDLNNILTRSGHFAEVYRSDWFPVSGVRQVNWVELNSFGVTDWHCHAEQTDFLLALTGQIKLVLFDARRSSPTEGVSQVHRFGAVRPLAVLIPPGVFHGLRNENSDRAGYLNVADRLYDHEDPDNYRLPFDSNEIPVTL